MCNPLRRTAFIVLDTRASGPALKAWRKVACGCITRPYLPCRKPFESEGSHHRLRYPGANESVTVYAALAG